MKRWKIWALNIKDTGTEEETEMKENEIIEMLENRYFEHQKEYIFCKKGLLLESMHAILFGQ